jgi:phosphoribosylaminoimidazole carboxylase (NCAIR synthetase)
MDTFFRADADAGPNELCKIERRVAMLGAGSTIVSDVGVMMAIVGNEGPMSCGHLRQSRPGHHLYQGLDKTKNKKKLGDVNKKIDRDNNDTHTQHQIIIKIITNDVDGHTHMYTCIELFEFTLLPRE